MKLKIHDYLITVENAHGTGLSTVYRIGAASGIERKVDDVTKVLYGPRAKAVKMEPIRLPSKRKEYALFLNSHLMLRYKVEVMARSGDWALVRRKGAMPHVANAAALIDVPKGYKGA